MPRRGNGALLQTVATCPVSHRLSVKVTLVKITNVCLLMTSVLPTALPRLTCTLTSDGQCHSVRRQARHNSRRTGELLASVPLDKPVAVAPRGSLYSAPSLAHLSNRSVVGTWPYPNIILLSRFVGPSTVSHACLVQCKLHTHITTSVAPVAFQHGTVRTLKFRRCFRFC